MGLPQQPRFGYDRALGALKTHVLYELRENDEFGLAGGVRCKE